MVQNDKAYIQKEFSMMVPNLKESQERTIEKNETKKMRIFTSMLKNRAFLFERVVTMLRRAMAEKHVREAP